ncbi:MAG TPA: hypothetical protein VGP95_15535 [Gemmatimonadaceae bacterium]|nr:hypothetical protein [Gemmatimonadaceae bacterium]
MRLDKKLLLIAPTIVLVLVVAGMVYAAVQLHVLASVSETEKDRDAFIASVERGEKTLELRQSISLLRVGLDVETKRTAAILASRDLLVQLAAIALVSCIVLAIGVRSVPRTHWPRFGRGGAASQESQVTPSSNAG